MASSSIANRRATLAGKTACDKDRVVVIDPQKLRQAGLVHLLEDWAAQKRLRCRCHLLPRAIEPHI